MSSCLSLARVLALVGGLALVAAFFMPWFASQGLLLSGQFLHNFLSSANPTELRRFLPSSTPSDVVLFRALVDLFAVCGAIAAAASVLGGLAPRTRRIANPLLGLSGLIPLLAWAVGIGRLPPGSSPEIGLWLIVAGALAILIGLAFELRPSQTTSRIELKPTSWLVGPVVEAEGAKRARERSTPHSGVDGEPGRGRLPE